MLGKRSLFRSSQGYTTLMAAYQAQLARWTVPVDSRVVPTRYGHTHLLAAGAEGSPPLLLIHGLSACALVWRPNIPTLSQTFRVYALDVIGDVGKSAPTRPPLRGSAYADWLVDVLDALSIERANVIGLSLGGWMTLKLAIHAPDRVIRIMPLCPPGLTPYRMEFVQTALRATLFRTRETIGSLARSLSPSTGLAPEDAEMLHLTIRYHRSKRVPLRLFSDEELGRISAPTTLLVGEHEAIFNPVMMVERARQTIPSIRADVIANAGHALNCDQPAVLHERARQFFGAAV